MGASGGCVSTLGIAAAPSDPIGAIVVTEGCTTGASPTGAVDDGGSGAAGGRDDTEPTAVGPFCTPPPSCFRLASQSSRNDEPPLGFVDA